jgi:hypothetical protein
MSYIKKIRYKRNQFLSVGSISIKQGDTDIIIDRTKAYMSSVFIHKKYSWVNVIETKYSPTNVPSVTSSASGGVWEITLDQAYKNLKIKCYTNADSIELYGENDVLISSYNYSAGFQSSKVDPNIPSFGETWKEYVAPTILPIQSINCNSKNFSGIVEGCMLGTDISWSSCPGYGPVSGTEFNNLRENIQPSVNGNVIRYKIIAQIPCGYEANLPDNVIVYKEDLVRDGCRSYYKKCVGDSCHTDKDGNKIYSMMNILGCTDGVYTNWKYEDCKDNKRKKTRQCIPPLNGGKPCPVLPLEEFEDCTNAVMSDWSDWNCLNRKATRTRTCLKPATNGGNTCSTDLVQQSDCYDGKLTEWKYEECKDNKRKKTRQCIQPLNGGKPCPVLPLEELENCTDGKLSEWKYEECKDNKRKKTRQCIQPLNGGKPCPVLPLEELEDCGDAVMSDWSNWDCLDGKATRTRTCIKDPINGGNACSTELLQQSECYDGKLTEWKYEEECKDNKKKKTRKCIQPLNGGKPCTSVSLEEFEDCYDTLKPVVIPTSETVVTPTSETVVTPTSETVVTPTIEPVLTPTIEPVLNLFNIDTITAIIVIAIILILIIVIYLLR